MRSGGPGPASPTVVVATQTLEVGADLDFDGLVTECASLSSLRQRFGRLNRLGLREKVQSAIIWDGKKQSPVYGPTPAHVFAWFKSLDDAPDMCAAAIEDLLRSHPPSESLDVEPELGPAVTGDLLDTWKQTSPRPLWDVPVAEYINPDDDTAVMLVWRDEPPNPALVEAYPPHPQEVAPVPLSAVRKWASNRVGVRWRGSSTAAACTAKDLRPGDVWVIETAGDDGRFALGCVLADSAADVADIPGERTRARGETLEAIENGEPLAIIGSLSGIDDPVVSPRLGGYVVAQRKRGQSLSTGHVAIRLEEHCQAVANLAGEMAKHLGLDRQLLEAAGALHDIGKADPRMQAWLGAAPGKLLAKSGQSASAMRNLRPGNLPQGWRHELLSARMLPKNASPMLTHLVAVHHGRCRPSVPEHGVNGHAAVDFGGLRLESKADELLELDADSISRFASLGNPWGAALLESVLVMADRIASRNELTAPIATLTLPEADDASPQLESFRADALDGRALLGWMAAVGALCVLSEARPTMLMWDRLDRAVFFGWKLEDAIDFLTELLMVAPPVCRPETIEEFNAMGEWGPAVGRWDGAAFKQSPLMGTGAATTGFQKAWPKLAAAIDRTKVREAIVGPWRYYCKLGQRWDPAEHAEHGSQWSDPSKDGSSSVHGANRLAIEALRLLPTIATGYTIGWRSEHQAITWPLWRAPLTINGVRVAIQQPMRERWMSRKISVGQLASFLPAEPCERLDSAEIQATVRTV